ncbi:hypothetical protein [Sulfitobacter donghicola]|uniref:Uncharacterized protein n=1 Tax=Sulfitobacter donghicola DSW-25 = KCTC 12864 = JCM 14565 TaxID=1300350 RepID=A0A073IJQ0_9RHOB|nr:hypothetical protein [Sulfitobacter donghicola]KEJ89984.1 hypothetical protein DSW25_07160 [Sulfitobacter donghicola DSW-25 = KCTC 12864 = JCM 14565]KIN66886.1 hypothetical protein Z948_590 [Sulfitobacter donghicola DSW-25 = KCTC 12864 = JCM 14565]
MKHLAALLFMILPVDAFACGDAVCIVNPDGLSLPEHITFQETRAGAGPGFVVDDVLVLRGARFGERFAGQTVNAAGAHDVVTGAALSPLTILAGEKGQNLSVVSFRGVKVLNGYGPKGFPKRDAQGEGAIAILFDQDQAAISIDFRGGERGRADILFLRRDGVALEHIPVQPIGESSVGFLRSGNGADIAGVVVTNRDPQGIAIDSIRFGNAANLG